MPRLALLIEKLDHDARSRIETLYSSCFETARTLDSGTLSEIENIFRQVCRWLERLGEQARGRRGAQSHESNLHARVRSALSFAIEALAIMLGSRVGKFLRIHLIIIKTYSGIIYSSYCNY